MTPVNSYFHSLFDHANDAIAIHDAEGRFLEVNRSLCERLGYSREELLQMTPADIESPAFTGGVHERIEKTMASGKQVFETWAVTKTGGKIPMEVSCSRSEFNGQTAVLCIARDISKRKAAEEALARSEEKYRDLVENINDAIFAIDSDGFITYISPAIESITGLDKAELIGQPFIQFICSEDRPGIMDQFSDRLAGDTAPGEYRLLTRSGQTRWVRSSSRPIMENGQITGIRGVLTDITEKKQLESQLVQSQKMEAMGTLAGGIAHDFNNILSAIIGYTELCLINTPEESDQKDKLYQVLSSGQRAKELIQQILTFSRQKEEKLRPMKIKSAAREAMKLLRASLPTTITITQHIDTDDAVMANPTQIQQILINLCTNAAEAIPETGGHIDMAISKVVLETEFIKQHPHMSPGPHVQISISDTGAGMTSETMKRIFDPYFTTKEMGRGTGLGLALVHGMVQSMGGTITVTSQIDKGSTFNIFLPVISSARPQESLIDHSLPTGTERILFVDDEPTITTMNKQMLGFLGYRVDTYTSSPEAFRTFQSTPDAYDLVITDMTMPDMTGAEMARQILDIRPDLPIILCTGYNECISGDRARALGIRRYALKPIELKQMAHLIREVLDNP